MVNNTWLLDYPTIWLLHYLHDYPTNLTIPLPDYLTTTLPQSWLPDYLTTTLPDYSNTWLYSTTLTTPPLDYPTTSLPDYLTTTLPDYPTTWLLHHLDYPTTWLPDYLTTRLPDYFTTLTTRLPTTWLLHYLTTRLNHYFTTPLPDYSVYINARWSVQMSSWIFIQANNKTVICLLQQQANNYIREVVDGIPAVGIHWSVWLL